MQSRESTKSVLTEPPRTLSDIPSFLTNPRPDSGALVRHAECLPLEHAIVTLTPSKQPVSGVAADSPPTRPGILRRLRNSAGIMLVEAIVAVGALALVIVGASQALLVANRIAATSRVLTAARSVVQRNIDTALTTTFTQATTPAILATTPATGSVWDDDGGGDNTVQISVQDNNSVVVASGVLTRTVTQLANADNAVVLQVTFSLTYTYRGRTDTVSMTTIRARDD